jgi:hypothetical protein
MCRWCGGRTSSSPCSLTTCAKLMQRSFGISRELLACSKDLVVIPRVFIVFERTIEGSKTAFDDELSDDGVVPVSLASIDPLRVQKAAIYGLIAMATTSR